jgi:hypothetical protein
MLRQRLLWQVLGRRLVERLVRAGWIEPVRSNRGIFYDKHNVHLALKRLGREGYLLNGHVRNGSFSDSPKVRRQSLEEALADIEL